MVSANFLLQKLQPYKKQNIVLVQDQNVGDIINGIIKTHGKYQDQYDKILPYFEDDDIVETAKNIFEFLKENCNYVIESDKKQTLRSPSAIIATGKTIGCDCKSYSLFFGGLLSAYKRKHKTDDKLFYRFAGYNGKDLQHVFVVIDHNGEKYWCDAVLDYFNDRSKIPTKIKDKNMALISMAGIGQNISSQIQDYTSIGKSRMVFGIGQDGSQQSDNNSDLASLLQSVDLQSFYQSVLNLFDNSTGRWKSRLAVMRNWTPKQRLAWYMERARQKDGWDPVQYTQMFGKMADQIPDQSNIPINWAIAYNLLLQQNYPNGTGGFPLNYLQFDITKVNPKAEDLSSFDSSVFDKIKSGVGGNILQLAQIWEQYKSGNTSAISQYTTGSGSQPGELKTTKAGFSPLLILALIGAGAAFFLRKK